MPVALGIVGGAFAGVCAGVWLAMRQEEGWALIFPLGVIGGVIGAVIGGVVGAVAF